MGNLIFVDASTYEGVQSWAIVLQSIFDLVPIVLFLVGSVVLLRSLYNKMVKGAYVLLAGGSIMIFISGVLKAIHKLLIGIAEIDYVILDKQFTPTSSIGFLLIFVALLGMFTKFNKDYTKVRSFTLPLLLTPLLTISTYDNSMIFVVIMALGAAGMLGMLIYMSARLKSIASIILFSVAIVAMLGMGYLSTKGSFDKAWIQISVNCVYQGCFMTGVLILNKKYGLGKEDVFYKE